MSSGERLLQLISSWMEQQQLCAEQLRKLARQLEALRQKHIQRAFVSVLKTALVGGSLIVLFALTVVTLGAAFPLLNVTAEVCTKKKKLKPTELFLKEQQNVEKRSADITEEIQTLFEKLKTKAEATGSCSEPDQVDRYVMTKVLTALARQSGLKGQVSTSFCHGQPQIFMKSMALIDSPAVMAAVAGILSFFTLQVSGEKFKPSFDEGLQQLIEQMSISGCNAELVVGATGTARILQQATDTWTGMIKKNHVTEACQILRDTADTMQRITSTLRQQFDDIKRMLDQSARQQQELGRLENESKFDRPCNHKILNKNTKTGNQEVVFIMTMQSNYSAYISHGKKTVCAENQTYQTVRCEQSSSQTNQQCGRNEETGGEQTGGSDPGETGGEQLGGGDAGSQKSDSDNDDKDPDYENNSDSSYESSDSWYKRRKSTHRGRKSISEGNEDTESNNQNIVSKLSSAVGAMGLLNAHSIKNKISEISAFIHEYKLKILCLTETWLRPDTGDQLLKEALPDNFKFCHEMRNNVRETSQKGGGVAVAYSGNLQETRVKFEKKTSSNSLEPFNTFEYVATNLKHDDWNQPIRVINVYRPPNQRNKPRGKCKVDEFLEEFQTLLDEVPKDDSTLITGDFNIHVNNNPKKFKKFLEKNNLHQHVNEPTYPRSGNTLDLVISRNVDVSNLSHHSQRL
ncbi:uncharacterized protein LOC103366937 [Stegastes partitus]|uniref:Uncharacterized protein LOC103366937 n=1 Tax=Stegastes partitus TaxID=144197 RepID=A0A9Y4KG07_9TELE|nr:PREDICTED: uncharacterized protein LOC103366937 [Stegastes partitus]